MRIALVHYTAPPVVGGVEKVMSEQARLLADAGHQVTILTGRGKGIHPAVSIKINPRFDSRYPQVLSVKGELDQGILSQGFLDLEEEIFQALEKTLPLMDVVILHNVASLHKNLALTAALYRYANGHPSSRFILWHHDLAWTAAGYAQEMHPGWPWDLLRTPWKGARQVIVSESRRQDLVSLMNIAPEDVEVIPSGVYLADFLGLEERIRSLYTNRNLDEAQPLVIAPVRITRRKNLELALRVIAFLKEKYPSIALLVTGPPGAHNPGNSGYFSELRSLREQLGLLDNVHFLAEIDPEGLTEREVASCYRLADFLLMPSLEEGFGIPILESALVRLPIFCADLHPLRSLAGPYASYFSPQEDPSRVAKMIFESLATDPYYQLRQDVRRLYTWEAIYHSRLLPLLEERS